LGLLPRAGVRLLGNELELTVRWCPLDDLTASTLLINIPRIIFLHFQAPCPSSVYLLVRGPLSSYLQGSVPSTPLQSHPCWSTFPELSFNIYKDPSGHLHGYGASLATAREDHLLLPFLEHFQN